jgi:hypothetical protein
MVGVIEIGYDPITDFEPCLARETKPAETSSFELILGSISDSLLLLFRVEAGKGK